MDPILDDAIEKAAERTREAEERLRQEPIESPEIVDGARTVEHRAEDLHELTTDAVDEAEGSGGP